MEQDSQFDYWRSFFLGAYLDRPRAAASERFQGRFLGGGSADSVIYHNLQADALTSHFGTRDSGLVLLGFIRSGQVSVTHGDDRREVLDSA